MPVRGCGGGIGCNLCECDGVDVLEEQVVVGTESFDGLRETEGDDVDGVVIDAASSSAHSAASCATILALKVWRRGPAGKLS